MKIYKEKNSDFIVVNEGTGNQKTTIDINAGKKNIGNHTVRIEITDKNECVKKSTYF